LQADQQAIVAFPFIGVSNKKESEIECRKTSQKERFKKREREKKKERRNITINFPFLND